MAEETLGVGDSRPGASMQGRSLGPYQVQRLLGRGGMAVVYRALHVPLDRVVALKVLLPSLSSDKEFVDRFLAEARAAARLDYPHIVPIYDSGEIGGVHYIAMKLLDGRDLKTLLAERRKAGTAGLPLEQAISITSQVAGALEYAHAHHLVHRDIKPANIIVDDNDRVTLTDFGIARALDRASATLTGTVLGTPTYMSPEQAQGKPVDYRSDLYSLGIVLYEMLTGVPPFTGNLQTVMYAHLFTPPPPLESLNADLPPGVGDVVLRALAKKPDDRFESAGALTLALTNAVGGELAQKALQTSEQTGYGGEPSASDAKVLESGPQTAMEAAAARATPPTATAARRLPLRLIGAGAALVAAVAAVLIWLFLAGPLAGGGSYLAVQTTPPGATVRVDGSLLGTTPLKQKLSPGSHRLVIAKPAYRTVQQTADVGSHGTANVSISLAPLPVTELVQVPTAIITDSAGNNAAGDIVAGNPVQAVRAGQKIFFVVTLVATNANQGPLTVTYQFALYSPQGDRIAISRSASATLRPGDAQGRSAFSEFDTDANAPAGEYQVKLFVENQEVVARQVRVIR